MYKEKTLTVNREQYVFYSFRGKVVSAKKDREVQVSGSGGGGTISGSSFEGTGSVHGTIKEIEVTSNTIVHDDFYLLNEESKEEFHVHLINWDIPVREGHEIGVVWRLDNDNSKKYVAIENFSLNEKHTDKPAFRSINRKLDRTILLIGICGKLLTAYAAYYAFELMHLQGFFWWLLKWGAVVAGIALGDDLAYSWITEPMFRQEITENKQAIEQQKETFWQGVQELLSG